MITDTREKILGYIRTHKQARPNDLVSIFGISHVAIHKQLKILLDKGSIKKVGKSPLVFYIATVVKKPTDADASKTKNHPYFLWDYDLTDDKIRTILKGNNTVEKQWIIARILTHARFEDVFLYLTVDNIVQNFTHLLLPPNVKNAWQRALNVWGYHV